MTTALKSKCILCFSFILLTFTGFSQTAGTLYTVGFRNVTTTANTIEGDITLTINGPVNGVRLSGMQVGMYFDVAILTDNPTLTWTRVDLPMRSRSPELATFINNTTATFPTGHLRISAIPLVYGSAFVIPTGTYTFDRYKLTSSTNWVANSNAKLYFSPTNTGGRTNTAVNSWAYDAIFGDASFSYSTTAPFDAPGVILAYTSAAPLSVVLNVALPVELLNFSGYTEGGNNLLVWTTAREINNKGFQIERLNPTTNAWDSIGFKTSARFKTAPTLEATYNFTDKTPFSISYYRLRQIDNDGKEQLSKVISLSNTAKSFLKVYPNPTADGFIALEMPENTEGVSVTNVIGQIILQQDVKGQNVLQIDVSAWAQGVYFIKTKENTEGVKFIKQ